jgi:hypothetical protein
MKLVAQVNVDTIYFLQYKGEGGGGYMKNIAKQYNLLNFPYR